jgi:small conductance mechanosensitive channel
MVSRMSLLDFFNYLGELVLSNIDKVLFPLISVIIGYIVYRVIAREITALKNRNRLEDHLAFTLTRVVKWGIALVVVSAVLAQLGVTIGIVSGLLTILGGTIIGFAAINTVGNAIAGLIVMTSRPFKVGDRIFFKGQFADVVSVELIYTKMVTLDNVLVSVPNQELLKAEIDNFGKKRAVRRHVAITPAYDYNSQEVERILLEAAAKVPRVLKDPKPYVWITNFKDYAPEYTLYVFISDIKGLPEIDAELHKAVLETCHSRKMDISTPLLLRHVQPPD